MDPSSVDELNAAGCTEVAVVEAFHPPLPIPGKDERVSVLPGPANESEMVT